MNRELPSRISDTAQTLVVNMPVLDPKSFANFLNGNYTFAKHSLYLALWTYVQF